MATVAEDAVIRKGTEIFRLMAEEPPAVFGKKYWAGRMMEAAMEHPDFKVALFRFIDVLPTLQTTAELTRHLEEYFLSEGSRVQAIARALVSGPAAGMAAPVASLLVRRNITSFSKIFIAGRDPREAARTLRRIRTEGGAFTVDLLGEAAVSETEADGYRDQYLAL
ncbi:MAG: L-glutamate gamma-semialdehyde dehydrogenase, partial [Verrucomicrobiota bacterium]